MKHTADHDAIAIGATRRGARALLWVDDAGTGVPENEAERIFERFQRLEAPGEHSGARFELWLPLRG